MAKGDNSPEAAELARKRIADLPDQYMAHAVPSKEDLVGIKPHSPAAEEDRGRFHISSVGRSDPPPADSSRPLRASASSQVSTSTSSLASATTAASATSAVPAPPIDAPKEVEKPAVSKKPKSPKPARKGRVPHHLKPIVSAALTFVFLLLLFKAPIFFSQLGYLTAGPDTTAESTQAVKPQIGPEPVLSIPKINVSAPIVFAKSNAEAAIQKDLESGVVHYANTAMPGTNGNSVIFGHSSNDWWEPGNYKFVFVLLDKLVIGDTLTINYNSQQYMYEVIETKVVPPTDLSVLNSNGIAEVTLITCTPPGTNWKRLIVRAKQVSPSPSGPPQAAAEPVSTGLTSLTGNNGASFSERVGKWWQGITDGF